MPPGLNSNGGTLPGRHGVATSPPGSQVFAHMCSLNNTTLPVWVYCLLAWWRAVAGTRWRHRQRARWGSLLPLVSCLTDEGFGGAWKKRGAWKELSKRNKMDAHSLEYFLPFKTLSDFIRHAISNLSSMKLNSFQNVAQQIYNSKSNIVFFKNITWILSF